jgi:hypothetical protein
MNWREGNLLAIADAVDRNQRPPNHRRNRRRKGFARSGCSVRFDGAKFDGISDIDLLRNSDANPAVGAKVVMNVVMYG